MAKTFKGKATKISGAPHVSDLFEDRNYLVAIVFWLIVATMVVVPFVFFNTEKSATTEDYNLEQNDISSVQAVYDIDEEIDTDSTVDTDDSTLESNPVIYTPSVTLAMDLEPKYLSYKAYIECDDSSNTQEKEYIIPVTEQEIGYIVQLVQHEVGSNETYFPNQDFDLIQQRMAKVIVNHVINDNLPDNITDAISYPGHFTSLEKLASFDSAEERTLKNVLTVLYGEDKCPECDDAIFEMSFISLDMSYNLSVMEEQVGEVNLCSSSITADGRCLIFAEPA